MSQCTVTINDEDRNIDYQLSVDFDFHPEEKPQGPSYASGGEPGYPAHSDINSVLCVQVTTWCGPLPVHGIPLNETIKCHQQKIGEWCLENFRSRIEDAVNEAYEIDSEPDGDVLRDAQIDRECEERAQRRKIA